MPAFPHQFNHMRFHLLAQRAARPRVERERFTHR